MTGGYTCMKGRQLAHQVHGPERSLQSLRRSDKGYAPIATQAAPDEIAAKLKQTIQQHGPRAILRYRLPGASL